MENDLSRLVRRVLLEAPQNQATVTTSTPSERDGVIMTPAQRDQAALMIFVNGALLYYIISLLGLGAVSLVGSLIEKMINDNDFQKREAMYHPQADGTLEVMLYNYSSGAVSLQRVYGGFLIPEAFADKDAPMVAGSSDITGRYAGGKTVGDFRGSSGKINVKSLLTGKPSPAALVMQMDGPDTKDGGATLYSGDITSVAGNMDVNFYAAPFVPTHALVRTEAGADIMIPAAYKRVGTRMQFLVIVHDRMVKRANKKEAKRDVDL